jgi:hypothetical protein
MQRRMRFQLEDKMLARPVAGLKIVFHIFRAPFFDELAGVGFKGVDARKSFWRRVVPLQKLRGFFVTEIFPPFFDEPFGLRPAERGPGNFQIGQEFFSLARFTQVAAQNGVHKTGLRAEAALLGEFHGFVDGGMVGNAVEPENLVEAEAQQVLEHVLLFASVGFSQDEPVECGLPADDAIDNFLAQPAIRR